MGDGTGGGVGGGVSPGASAPPSSFSAHLGAEGFLWRDLGRTRGRSCSVRWEIGSEEGHCHPGDQRGREGGHCEAGGGLG